MFGRVVLHVDLNQLGANFKKLRYRAGSCRLMAVVKANAYGLGAVEVASTLKQAGADCFGVATLHEATQIVNLGLPVQVLGVLFEEEIPQAVELGIRCPCPDLLTAQKLSRQALKQKKIVDVALKVDSGMGRLGFLLSEAFEVACQVAALPGLKLRGIYSHLPEASVPGDKGSEWQIAELSKLANQLLNNGIFLDDVHIAASDGINFYPAALGAPFNLGRVGLSMYGVHNDPELPCCFRLSSRLGAIRRLPAGSTIGYHRTHTLSVPTFVGTVAAGYADGLPFALSNRGVVAINGVKCPVLGRICMDYTTISLEAVPDASVGDEVELFGKYISPLEWVNLKQTHLHDILCAISQRVVREYTR